MAKHHPMKLTLHSDLSCLPIAQLFVRETARSWGCPESDLYRFDLVIEEAVANVIEFAFEDDENSTFDILCDPLSDGIRVTIRERGLPFDPSQLPSYNAEADIDSRSNRGMGIFLMKEMMDEVTFNNLGAGGKETIFVKRFRTAPAARQEALMDPDTPLPDAGRPKREAVSYTVRLMEPQEAIEISKCAYRSHGYSFFTDHIYYPEQIVEMNRNGHMLSAVAVTDDGKFMGHGALVYPFQGSRIAELTYIFVNIEYRGQGCMDRLCNFLYTVPKPSTLDGIYTYSVTNHVFTQRVMAKMDIRDCGFLLATSPATWQFRGIDGDETQRISVALSYRYLTAPRALDLYPPPNHLEMVRSLYRHLSVEHRFPGPASGLPHLPEGPSRIETEVFGPEGCAEVRIVKAGREVVREIRRILRDLCLNQIAAVQLFLRLEDPNTYFLGPEIERLGFFFAGIMPGEMAGDALILQYLNNVPFDYGKVQAYTPVAKEVLAYIRACDPNEAI
ncbi:MAG: ATP-binding protein [Deltaproteobacteria bacterium]|nr:ATP-binding protein [Deltaproteobacteria bacterium]